MALLTVMLVAEEFDQVQQAGRHHTSSATMRNKPKNRYNNVTACTLAPFALWCMLLCTVC
jgi:hypothetical protein